MERKKPSFKGPASARSRGLEAEDRAASWLAREGFVVLRRRFQGGAGEADLILLDGDTLVFVEVKQRSGSTPAEWSVTPDKQARLRSAALAYLAEVGEHERPVRFDVVAVQGDQIRHLPGAF